MILETSELQEIKSLISGYSSISIEFEIIEETINNLRNKQEQLIHDLKELRSKESLINNSFTSKYGNGKLNLETFEYELNNK